MKPILEIKNLKIAIDDKVIIDDLSLTINPGEIHAIMGPNGSGKSTLANVLARHPDYKILSGEINYLGKNLIKMTPEECAWQGIFLSFQYPIAIPGVSNMQFLKTAVNAVREHQNKSKLDAVDFIAIVKTKMHELNMPAELLQRALNDGFSGGEKKCNEILQLCMLEPTLAILDEIDSGLDIDALKNVALGINAARNPNKSILLITHYQRLLDHVTPDIIHIMMNGRIVKSGDKQLANKLEQQGYSWITE